jgi:hypothetical protein
MVPAGRGYLERSLRGRVTSHIEQVLVFAVVSVQFAVGRHLGDGGPLAVPHPAHAVVHRGRRDHIDAVDQGGLGRVAGGAEDRRPACLHATAAARTPRTGRSAPSRASSPMATQPLMEAAGIRS